jgi:hypothetical protein
MGGLTDFLKKPSEERQDFERANKQPTYVFIIN